MIGPASSEGVFSFQLEWGNGSVLLPSESQEISYFFLFSGHNRKWGLEGLSPVPNEMSPLRLLVTTSYFFSQPPWQWPPGQKEGISPTAVQPVQLDNRLTGAEALLCFKRVLACICTPSSYLYLGTDIRPGCNLYGLCWTTFPNCR